MLGDDHGPVLPRAVERRFDRGWWVTFACYLLAMFDPWLLAGRVGTGGRVLGWSLAGGGAVALVATWSWALTGLCRHLAENPSEPG